MNKHALETTRLGALASCINLTPLLRLAGIPHPVWGSPGLAKRYGLSPAKPLPLDRRDLGDLAWAVRLALNGLIPSSPQTTAPGTGLLVEFSTFLADLAEVQCVRLVITSVPDTADRITLRLSFPGEVWPPVHPRILVVEDDPQVARVLGLFLRRGGWEVIWLDRGADVLVVAGQQQPDLVLLDVNLLDANGLDLCRRLKADPATANIPIVFCSGTYEARATALALGAADFLEKPGDLLRLDQRLRSYLPSRPTANEGESTKSKT